MLQLKMIIAESKDLLVRQLVEKDAKAFSDMSKDGSLEEIGFTRDCYQWMDNWIKETIELNIDNNPLKDYLAYTLEEKRTGKVVGSVGCSYYYDLDTVGICYFISAEYRNRGYATQAAEAYLQYYFENYDLSQIIATIKDSNTASWKVAEKTGFELIDTKMYKDINDECEELYRFYRRKR